MESLFGILSLRLCPSLPPLSALLSLSQISNKSFKKKKIKTNRNQAPRYRDGCLPEAGLAGGQRGDGNAKVRTSRYERGRSWAWTGGSAAGVRNPRNADGAAERSEGDRPPGRSLRKGKLSAQRGPGGQRDGLCWSLRKTCKRQVSTRYTWNQHQVSIIRQVKKRIPTRSVKKPLIP